MYFISIIYINIYKFIVFYIFFKANWTEARKKERYMQYVSNSEDELCNINHKKARKEDDYDANYLIEADIQNTIATPVFRQNAFIGNGPCSEIHAN